jgi:hypothetical protein
VQSYNASFPAEIWINSSEKVKPENSRQLSIGIFNNIDSGLYQSSVEVYYKTMGNQLLFKGGNSPSISNIEENLIFGKGEAYGTEFALRKTKGMLKGSLGYAYSFIYQQFDSLNYGLKFPGAHDRRHSLNATLSYIINKNWSIGTQFLTSTGGAFTVSTEPIPNTSGNQDYNPLFDEQNNNNNGNNSSSQEVSPNNYHIKPYNRLDLSLSYRKNKILFRRKFETQFVFCVYNVYAHRNTSLVYRTIDPQTRQPVLKEVSFFPILPSLTYSLMF